MPSRIRKNFGNVLSNKNSQKYQCFSYTPTNVVTWVLSSYTSGRKQYSQREPSTHPSTSKEGRKGPHKPGEKKETRKTKKVTDAEDEGGRLHMELKK